MALISGKPGQVTAPRRRRRRRSPAIHPIAAPGEGRLGGGARKPKPRTTVRPVSDAGEAAKFVRSPRYKKLRHKQQVTQRRTERNRRIISLLASRPAGEPEKPAPKALPGQKQRGYATKTLTSGLGGGASGIRGLYEDVARDLTEAAITSPAGVKAAVSAVGHDVRDVVSEQIRGKTFGAVPLKKRDPTPTRTIKLTKEMGKAAYEDLRHPLRHPGYTLLTASALAGGGAGAVSRVGALGRATSAARLAGKSRPAAVRSGLTRKGAQGGSLLRRPRGGREEIAKGVFVRYSNAPLTRAVQRRKVRLMQRHERQGKVSLGIERKRGRIRRETHRISEDVARAPATALRREAKKLDILEQTAPRVVAEGATTAERAAYHRATIGEERTTALARRRLRRAVGLLSEIDRRKMLVDTPNGPVFRAPNSRVAKAYDLAVESGLRREAILEDLGLMTPEGIAKRKQTPGRLITGAKHVRATPGKLGIPSRRHVVARRRVIALQKRYDTAAKRALEKRAKVELEPWRELTPAEKRRKTVAYDPQGRPIVAPARGTKRAAEPDPSDPKARLAWLDKKFDKLMKDMEGLVKGAGKSDPRETAYINRIRARQRRKGVAESRLEPTQLEMVRREAEAALERAIERNPDQPDMKALAAMLDERRQLRNKVNEDVLESIGPEPEAPLRGVQAVREERMPDEFEEVEGGQAALGVEGEQRGLPGVAAGREPARLGEPEDKAALQDAELMAAELSEQSRRAAKAGDIDEATRLLDEARAAVGEAPTAPIPPQPKPKPATKRARGVRTVSTFRPSRFSPSVQRLGGALGLAKEEFISAETARLRRMEPTGIVGAEAFNRGKAYVPYMRRIMATGPARLGTEQMISVPRQQLVKGEMTGASLKYAMYRDNAIRDIADAELAAQRLNIVLRVRETAKEIAISNEMFAGLPDSQAKHYVPMRMTSRPFTPEEREFVDTMLGKLEDGQKLTRSERKEMEGMHEHVRNHVFPDRQAARKELAEAAEGETPNIVWVDQRELGGINVSDAPMTGFGKGVATAVDEINAAQQLAILFLKPAYITPNLIGNAALGLIQQGFAAPWNAARAVHVYRQLTPTQKEKVRAGIGSGIAEASPIERGKFFKGSRDFAAKQYAKILDSPFRWPSFIHEARMLGYEKPADLVRLIDSDDPIVVADRMEAFGRMRDAMIDYQKMTPFEQKYVRRAIFFYPWVKGSFMYTGRFLRDHPVQAGVLAQLAKEAAADNLRELGPVPWHQRGIFKVGGSKQFPQVVSPRAAQLFESPVQAMEAVKSLVSMNPEETGYALTDMISPGLQWAGQLLAPHDPLYGYKVSRPEGLARQYVKNLPQYRLTSELRGKTDKEEEGEKLYPTTAQSALLKYGIGTIWKRKANRIVLNEMAIDEMRSSLPKTDRIRFDLGRKRAEMTNAYRGIGALKPGQRLPPSLREAWDLRTARLVGYERKADEVGRELKPIERTEVILDVMVGHKLAKRSAANAFLASIQDWPEQEILNRNNVIIAGELFGERLTLAGKELKDRGYDWNLVGS